MPLKIISGQPRVFGGNSSSDEWVMLPGGRFGLPGNDKPAETESQVQRFMDVCHRLHQYVAPANPGIRDAVFDIDWHVAGLDENEVVLAAIVFYQQTP